jgi:putative hydrolase of the HAD superfamily
MHNQPSAKTCSIDLLLFDFGGVLAEEGFRNGLISIAHLNGQDPELFLKKAYDITFNRGFVLGNADEKTFWQALREHTGIQGSDQELRNEILSRFTLRGWMLEIIKQLHNDSLLLAILSDQTNWLDELDAQYDFFKLFDRVFNSYHLGKCKKDVSLFEDVLAEMSVRPERSLFIDDTKGNIVRAQQKGLHTIHYQGRETFMQSLVSFCPFLQ